MYKNKTRFAILRCYRLKRSGFWIHCSCVQKRLSRDWVSAVGLCERAAAVSNVNWLLVLIFSEAAWLENIVFFCYDLQ